jgi:very-short-patch-repair endonuclease
LVAPPLPRPQPSRPATLERGESRREGILVAPPLPVPNPLAPRLWSGARQERGELVFQNNRLYACVVNPLNNARRLRRDQTDEEKELWRALRAGRFAGFKFRRQYIAGNYYLDFYCPAAKLSIEFDGFQHGMPEQRKHDEKRRLFLETMGIEELRFWNHQWNKNRDGVLLEIWHALARRTGCVEIMRKIQNHRFIPPPIASLKPKEEPGN